MSIDIRVFLFYTFIVTAPFWFYLAKKKVNDWTYEVVSLIGWFSGGFSIVTLFVLSPIRVPSSSMEPSLNKNSFHLIHPTAFSISMPGVSSLKIQTGQPKRGDIIGFYSPVNQTKLLAKRVIGLPGETLTITAQNITTSNGRKVVAKEFGVTEGYRIYEMNYGDTIGRYQFIEGASLSRDQIIEVQVPKDAYFVLGDNRDNSNDSRQFGFVSIERIAGRVIW